MPPAARARTHTRPVHPRRVSGPLRPLPAGSPARRGNTGVFERLRALPEHRVVDRLLRGRVWIWLIGVLLGGIVAMQVSLLKLNAGIGRAVTTAGTLERQNAHLEAEIARLSSGERIRAAAADEGMVMPSAGAVAFLTSRPERDARLARRRMQPPSDDAAQVMANGGREPGVLAAVDPVTGAAVDPLTGVPAPTAASDPEVGAPAVDPVTGAALDPATGAPVATEPAIDPATGAPVAIDPATGAPATDPAAAGTAVVPGQG